MLFTPGRDRAIYSLETANYRQYRGISVDLQLSLVSISKNMVISPVQQKCQLIDCSMLQMLFGSLL